MNSSSTQGLGSPPLSPTPSSQSRTFSSQSRTPLRLDPSSLGQALLTQEAEHCIGCRKCMVGCPMLRDFCKNPKDLLHQLNETGLIPADLPYACLLCGYCTSVCPTGVSLRDLFYQLRAEVVAGNGGKVPSYLRPQGTRLFQKLSFSPLFRGKIPTLPPPANTPASPSSSPSRWVFFPGCSLAAASLQLIPVIFSYLQTKVPGIALYSACCGTPTRFLREDATLQRDTETLRQDLSQAGVTTLITACSNCYMTLKKTLGDGGEPPASFQVLSLYPLLRDWGLGKEVQMAHPDGYPCLRGQTLTLHDPCPTRFETDIHEAVRGLLDDLQVPWTEYPLHGQKTLCCGRGGGGGMAHPQIGLAQKDRRIQETPTSALVSYCSSCVEQLRHDPEKSLYTVHLLDLLFAPDTPVNQASVGPMKKWYHRYQLARFASHA